MLHTMSLVRTYVTSKMCYVRTNATHEYDIIFLLMLHTKMYNITYVAHEYEVFFW